MNDNQPGPGQYLAVCGLVGLAVIAALPFLTIIGGI